ncbi:MAG: hypothetical protein EBU84_05940 [Actinobacteria bacterium]|nr:hypothetical protein [Actinomycetota bacterium]
MWAIFGMSDREIHGSEMKTLTSIGLAIGGINYLLTAGYFFSNEQTGLGLVQLLVPPAELVLPWVASPTLGIISLVSLVMIVVGAATSD